MPTATAPPRWDLTPLFPSLDSHEFHEAFEALFHAIDELSGIFEHYKIEKREVHESITQVVEAFETATRKYNTILDQQRLLGSYLGCLVTTDSHDSAAQARMSEMQVRLTPLRKLSTRFTAWIGELNVESVLQHSPLARNHEYALIKAKISATHLMRPGEEALASDLGLTGSTAWSKLHGDMTSQIDVEVPLPSGKKSMAMSMVRNLAYDADRQVRKAGFEAEIAAWKRVEVPLAASMNSIKGEVNTLGKHRGWDSPLDEALFNANIDRGTLEAMMEAARESYPFFRRYMHAKAKALGIKKLAFYDLFAPISSKEREWSYDEAADFVSRHFHSYSQRMGDFADLSFKENWTDAEPRAGKRDGAYCTGTRPGESRIMMNFKPSFGAVSTLAHELGHGYHNLCLKDRTALQRNTPMTLAETASIFCETIIKRAALEQGTHEEQLSILEASIMGACQTVVDISSRFLFEQDVFDRRVDRELSPAELCDSMLHAQRQTYGDGLDMDALHPYMWAVKPHYYSGRSFYNFPYMFGLLFSLGLYTIYVHNPEEFKSKYDSLLASTGLADAATLALGFGIDIKNVEFWRGSLAQIEFDIEKFEKLVG